MSRRQRRQEILELTSVLRRLGARPWQFQLAYLSSVVVCTSLWITAKTVDQRQRAHAERRALYVGLWTPTLYLIGRSLQRPDA